MNTLKENIKRNQKRHYEKYVKEAKACSISFGCSIMTFSEYLEWKKEAIAKAEGK